MEQSKSCEVRLERQMIPIRLISKNYTGTHSKIKQNKKIMNIYLNQVVVWTDLTDDAI